MNDTNDMDERYGNDEVERRLRAYADARLSPSPEAVERMRAAVVARAAGAAAMREVIQNGPVADHTWRLAMPRRAAAVLLAATVATASAAAVLAATPGSPLYGTRLWVEGMTLPTQSDARSAAQVDELGRRIDEARAAVTANDRSAVAAALAAFREETTAALRDAGDDPARLAQLQAALETHIVALTALEAGAPPPAVAAIEAAIAASSNAIRVIEVRGHVAPGGPTWAHTPPPHPTPEPSHPDRTPAPHTTPPPHP